METGIVYTRVVSDRARRISIKINAQGDVVVTTPRWVANRDLSRFVEASRDWIVAHKEKVATKPRLISLQAVYYLGKEYALKQSNKMDGSVRFYQDSLILAPTILTAKNALVLLEKWLQSKARHLITQRTQYWSDQMQLLFNGMAFKQQKTRWGSCSSTKHLNFNWKLIHAPLEVIDYVIIHELSHTKHMNHGKQFWDLVARFDPDHPHHRRWLQRFGSTED